MKWSYDLAGAEPIIKDMPVYNATVITNGEYLALGTSAFTAGADAGYGLVNGIISTVGSAFGINGVGVSLQTISTAGNGMFYSGNEPASVATALNGTAGAQLGMNSTAAFAYAKVIINPLAVYRTQVSVNTSGTADLMTIVSSTTPGQFCVTGLPVSSFDGSWVYFAGTAGPNFGNLRKITSSATTGTMIMDAVATTTITTADKVVFISERNTSPNYMNANTNSNSVTGNGTVISSSTNGTVGANKCTQFRVVENYIDGGTYLGGITELRYEKHGQLNFGAATSGATVLAGSKTIKFWQEIISLSHAFKG